MRDDVGQPPEIGWGATAQDLLEEVRERRDEREGRKKRQAGGCGPGRLGRYRAAVFLFIKFSI
jgi:hypothetical protein